MGERKIRRIFLAKYIAPHGGLQIIPCGEQSVFGVYSVKL